MSHWMSTYVQFVAMVRVPLVPAPPAAVNDVALMTALPLAIESHSGSLPDVASSTAPLDPSGVPSSIVPTKLVAC